MKSHMGEWGNGSDAFFMASIQLPYKNSVIFIIESRIKLIFTPLELSDCQTLRIVDENHFYHINYSKPLMERYIDGEHYPQL